MIHFYGLTKTTLLDYPGYVSAILFTGGCNFNCPYCQNAPLLHPDSSDILDEKELLCFLKKRSSLLEGLVITGGEPTIWKELPETIRQLKSLGYRIKLDTNGSNPDMLAGLIRENLLDYIAMDVKSGFSAYEKACGCKVDRNAVKESIRILMNSGLSYEFRVTCVDKIHTEKDFHEIGNLLEGADLVYLQNFRDSESVRYSGLSPLSEASLKKAAEILQLHVRVVRTR